MAGDLATFLDSARLRDLAYVAVALLAVAVFVWERRLAVPVDDTATVSPFWPTYWLLTAGVVLTMALGRAGLGDILTEFGRRQAYEHQWYEARRGYQAVAVALVAAMWFIGVIAAIWRVPPRRRRYLPNVVAVTTMVALAAIRMISLHQVDALLYNRDIAGVRVIAVTELTTLVITAITIVASPLATATHASA